MEHQQENKIESKILPIVSPQQIQHVEVQEWKLSDESIASYVDSCTAYEMNAFNIPWFQFRMEAPEESEQEKQEKQVAIKEQVEAGILKVYPMAGNPGQCIIGLPNQPPPGAELESTKTKAEQHKNRLNLPTFNSVGPMKKDPMSPNITHASKESLMAMFKNQHRKIEPNDKCPCGSGKKAKRCHYTNLNKA